MPSILQKLAAPLYIILNCWNFSLLMIPDYILGESLFFITQCWEKPSKHNRYYLWMLKSIEYLLPSSITIQDPLFLYKTIKKSHKRHKSCKKKLKLAQYKQETHARKPKYSNNGRITLTACDRQEERVGFSSDGNNCDRSNTSSHFLCVTTNLVGSPSQKANSQCFFGETLSYI